MSTLGVDPDPPSRRHLPFDRLTILSEFEGLAAYYLYASVGAPWRLASNTSLVPRDSTKSIAIIANQKLMVDLGSPYRLDGDALFDYGEALM